MSQREEKIHLNVGGPRGWTTACGIESANFVDEHKPDEWEDVDCQRCLNSFHMKGIDPEGWHIDETRGVPGYSFAVCGPFRNSPPGTGTAVLGCFAYKPHAKAALAAIREAEAAGKFP